MPCRPAIRALLIDLSGTLHIGSEQTPSAVRSLQRLREAKIPIRFCSNTSKESTYDLRERLKSIGFDVHDGELWTSLGALKAMMEVKGLRRPYCLLSKSAMKELPGCVYAGDTDEHHENFDSVVVGLAPEVFTYDRLTKAFRTLLSSDESSTSMPKPLITTHRARYVRTSDGELSLGPGPFVVALENATASRNLQAISVGKPSREFFERVLATLPDDPLYSAPDSKSVGGESSISWRDVAVIGDDIEADLGEGAHELGLWRVLVKTGKYQRGDEQREGVLPPNEVYDCFTTFVENLLEDRR
ncbi:hypothetical protein SCHPADRAFT_908510 [Schizopora paradoxa]|uniref:HAD-like protein n=1 Tax=Schizopora paradoxa TaxID=27342 RepID=A0A0H2RUW4_9AGAM|nr:hypothetical protein SCHPADRAFT_908510 [Schizopora paradoxa]